MEGKPAASIAARHRHPRPRVRSRAIESPPMARKLKLELGVVTMLAVVSVLTAWALPHQVPTGLVGRFWASPDWTAVTRVVGPVILN